VGEIIGARSSYSVSTHYVAVIDFKMVSKSSKKNEAVCLATGRLVSGARPLDL
jgi:hypothetical protein